MARRGGKKFSPVPDLWLEVPDRMRGQPYRLWNRAAKTALRKMLTVHHRAHIPEHFKKSAPRKYRVYKERTFTYRRKKKILFRSQTDLKKEGKTERRMRRSATYRVAGTLRGSAAGVGLHGSIRLRFGFRGSQDNEPGKVGFKQMGKEIKQITKSEANHLAKEFAIVFDAELQKELDASKARGRKR